MKIAIVYGVPAGIGGLGLQAASAITDLGAGEAVVHAFGPGRIRDWPLPRVKNFVIWHESPEVFAPWRFRYSWWRWYQGRYQFKRDRLLGRWATKQLDAVRPECCYVFTQVGLETLRWAKRKAVPTVLDNPNGHIRHYMETFAEETQRWSATQHLGHPTMDMVARVEEEYHLANRIRVSSEWAKRSMIAYGVPGEKINVIQQPINLERYRPNSARQRMDGPLRVCYVGSLNLAKGFQYLIRAIKRLGAEKVRLEIVGATGSRVARRIFEEQRKGINCTAAPGDSIPAYHRAEIFILPSLHDGFGFVVAEAMACGLPVIVTENCGAAECVRLGHSGWVVPAGDEDALAAALESALRNRAKLRDMGQQARNDIKKLGHHTRVTQLREYVCEGLSAAQPRRNGSFFSVQRV
jgi:glycosyltransferase involved in cell wall biosynthesis